MKTGDIFQERLKALEMEMLEAGILEKDIKEQFVRSSGSGGQNVNKVATCVLIQHLPTGTIVKCQHHRTQERNRVAARELLLKKILQQREAVRKARIEEREKERRRRRKRTLKGKEKMLEEKHWHSRKKEDRRKFDLRRDEE